MMADLVRLVFVTNHGTQMVFEVDRSIVPTLGPAMDMDRHLQLQNMADRRVTINMAYIYAIFVPVPQLTSPNTTTEVILHGPIDIQVRITPEASERLNRFPKSAQVIECIWFGAPHQMILDPSYLSLVEVAIEL